MSLRQPLRVVQDPTGARVAAEELMESVLKQQQETLKYIETLKPLFLKAKTQHEEMDALLIEFIQHVGKRSSIAASIFNKIDEYKKSEEEKHDSYIAFLQNGRQQLTKEIKNEDELQDKLLAKMDEVEASLAEMKKQIDSLPVDRAPYISYIKEYDRRISMFNYSEVDRQSFGPRKKEVDLSCEITQKRISDELQRIALDQMKKEKKKSSPSSNSHTPPSDSEVLASSGDKGVSLAGDSSDVSLPRRDSSSSDELKKEKPRRSSSPIPPSPMLSSSAIMSAALPPPSHPAPKTSKPLADAGQVQSVVGKSSSQLNEEQKRQPTDKGLADLVAKLGLSKYQSAASSPQLSSAGSVVTPVLQQQRNSLN